MLTHTEESSAEEIAYQQEASERYEDYLNSLEERTIENAQHTQS